MAVEAQSPAPAAPARPRPKREREEEVLVWPDLVFIEFIAAVLFTVTFLILSVFINAPLLNRANLNVTPNPSKAPWYFLNLQELLLHMDKAWAGVLVPTVALAFFALIPYVDRSRHMQGVWFGTKYSARITVVTAIYAMIVSFGLVTIDAGDTTGTEQLHALDPGLPGGVGRRRLALPARRGRRHPQGHRLNQGHLQAAGVRGARRQVAGGPGPRRLAVQRYWHWDLGGIGLPNIHGWGGEHLNIPAATAEQVIPLSSIAFFAVLIIYILFRLGWVRTRRDVMIVMFTGVMAGYLALTLVGSFFRGPGAGPGLAHRDQGG